MKLKAVILMFSIVFISSCSNEQKTIGLKQNIHHDDFEYSVQSVEKREWFGSVKAKGMFYLVTFRVENDAKRVEHKWDNNITYLIDENGKEYENSYDQQVNLLRTITYSLKKEYHTAAGKTESTILVFDVPTDVKEPYLKVRGDFLMGDLFDGNQFKNTKIKLF